MDLGRLNLEDLSSDNPGPPNKNDKAENEVNLASRSPTPDFAIDKLCQKCKAIDFDEVLHGEREPLQWSGHKQDVIANLGPVDNWDIDSCALCKALFNLIPVNIRAKAPENYALQSFTSEQSTIEMYGPDLADHYPLLADLPRRVLLQMRDVVTNESSFKVLLP